MLKKFEADATVLQIMQLQPAEEEFLQTNRFLFLRRENLNDCLQSLKRKK